VLFAFKAVGKREDWADMDRESEGKGRIKRKKGEKEKDICEKWRFYPSLSFSLSLSLSLSTPDPTVLSSRHRNFLWHPFVAALARLLLKPAALRCNYDVSGGSSKVRFQRQLKDGLKMSKETAWQLH